ncbi:MAG TPA: alpha-2-macroglobulin family protein [Chitinophagaceae bacterium]|nr:alpha-2-macroglobulin family protein [Chitinophagaceae bacterium]
MKFFTINKLFLFITFTSFIAMNANSQQPVKNYEKLWKKVEAFSKKGLPKSAMGELKNIYVLAKKEGQDAQVIKAMTYGISLQNETREDNGIFSIADVEKELAATGKRESTTSILKSLLADMYWDYFQQHRWQIYDRTATDKFDKKDIATWTAADFHKKITGLYLESITEENILKTAKPEPFDAIIIKGNVRHLRPTLYDILAHRALDYFQNDERDITKPAYAFEINTTDAFAPALDFVLKKFTTRDSASLQHKALLLYQKLIAFHLHDTKPDALIDVDLARLAFVNSNATVADKTKLYFDALTQITEKYKNLPAASQAWYLTALQYVETGSTYKPFDDTTHRYDLVKAKEISEFIQQQKDSSEGKINSFNLLNSLNSRSFTFTIENVNVPAQPFRAFVEYKNVTTLYFRIIKSDEKLKELLSKRYDNEYWNTLINHTAFKTWEQTLPDTKDLQQHTTEVRIDALQPGEYILLASDNKKFSNAKALLGARYFYVSYISYASNQQDYFVLNRDNGQPIANAKVQVWKQQYDYDVSKYIKVKDKLYTTNDKGYFKMEEPKTEKNRYNNTYLFEINSKDDRLFLDEGISSYYFYNQKTEAPKEINTAFLFTDRSLYRPGQTVYFKAIVLKGNTHSKNSMVNPNFSTKLVLRDANYQVVDTLKLITNEFGSVNGKFQLPQTGMNGQFSIYIEKVNGGNTQFRVEEYKRPKFYVDYEPIKGTYKVNDKITVTGTAKAYAGNNIDGANVNYRVVRQPRFIYDWFFWRWWMPPTEEMEITHGEVKTDKDGKFTIAFNAIPDNKIDKKFEPVFDYRVYADVTDINGETRSGETSVSVSYKSMMLVAQIPSTLPADSLKKLHITTQNMNGEFEPSTIHLSITKLNDEKRLIRKRFWERPDQFVMSKEAYISYFPYDEYDNETDYKSWAKGQTLVNKQDTAKKDGSFAVGTLKFSPGIYILEINAKNKSGEEVKDVKYLELTDESSKQLNRPQYLWTGINNTLVEPGETAKIELGTAADNLFVVQLLNKQKADRQNTTDYSFLTLNNQKQTFSFNTTEADRGGFGVGWMFIKHNRFYQQNQTIQVPWTNKDLNIEYASFRDKTLPGSDEKWKVKINGYKKEKLAAEMLAGMYDASLDQFYPHSWNKPYVWSNFYSNIRWNENSNFTTVNSQTKYVQETESKNLYKVYDFLFPAVILSSNYRGSIEPLWWRNPLDYAYSEVRNPRLMRLPKDGKMEMMKSAMPAPAEAAGRVVTDSVSREDKEVTESKGDYISSGFINEKQSQQSGDVKIRKNFNETAFFFPDLRTDSTGAIEFSFTMPEALTKWKFMALAHTQDAAFGASTREIITQKDLMVQPNAPRFLREGDKMEFSSKIVNLTDKEITGSASLQLFDATTNEPVDGWFSNMAANQYFTIGAGQSGAVKFPIEVPYLFNKALVWRIVATSGNLSDGEENMMPVLSNRMLVTESLPINMRGTGTKNFTFNKLLSSGNSSTLQHQSITVEYTGNPAWYAIQALPYLMEYPYDCAEQTWNRYYANSLATYISNTSPKIKQVFEKWKISDTAALMSNLEKNQELKAVLLEETPWVLDAKNEAQQKRNIALLFDMVKMSEQLGSAYNKLIQMQSSNGGFVWFTGGPDDRYMTQYIVTGIGHLKKLNAIAKDQNDKLRSILQSAIPYLDRKIKEDYDNLIKYKTNLKTYTPGYTEIQYLYMRSFFPEYDIAAASKTAYNYFKGRIQKTWVGQSKYMQGMIALALHRAGDAATTAAILKSLKETSITNEEMGMYWKNQRTGWFWYEAPIETQALLIETFQEAGKDQTTVDNLKTWLLKDKQTNNWKTTKATAEACYALLLQGSSWLSEEPSVEIKLGNNIIVSSNGKEDAEAGTGYIKKTVEGKKVDPQMGNINVTVSGNKNNTPVSWGSVYWQYFEDLDKITNAATPLNLSKKLFVEKNSDRGPVLTPVNEGDVLNVGDKIKVRIELRVDRDMEYVHMKDMRASALEPVNVLSQYKWQGGLGYYESTKDASTNFFFNYLRRGTYVFEYPLFITHTGNFSNGITTIQCMYAPEFISHSEGVRITVE